MFGSFRNEATVIVVFALLSGCGAPAKPVAVLAAAPAPPPPAIVFSLNTPVHIIAANPRGRAVLEADIPGLMHNRSYLLVDDMSLAQIASVSGGRFTTAKLNQLEYDLARISTTN